MGFWGLFSAASMPVIKVLIVTALGSFLALDSIDIFGQIARKHVNNLVFFVFSPALMSTSIAKSITFESFVSLWFMPVNILLTFIIGSALGWLLFIITKPPQHLKGLVIGTCAAGNLGSLLLIIVPAVCKEKSSPLGDPDVCSKYGMAYASLSMAIGAILLWSYVYNLIRVFSDHSQDTVDNETTTVQENLTPMPLPLSTSSTEVKGKMKVMLDVMKKHLGKSLKEINWKALFAPSTIGAIVGFGIGTVAPIRKLLIGRTAPLRVLQDSASFVGDAAIPAITLVVGGNLVKGIKGSDISLRVIFGIIVVRYAILPLFGILIVKGALHFGLLHKDPLYLFVLLLQYALPPAMNIGTITQLFGAGESDCSVIMLWTYCLSSISLTLWSTFFMWLIA